MKPKAFLLILITFLINSKSVFPQDSRDLDWEWAPIGAVWMYATTNMNFTNPESSGSYGMYWFVQSVKDTVINNTPCRKLEVTRFTRPHFTPVKMPSRYTYRDQGDIYYYDKNLNDFTLAFSYDIDYGDTVNWNFPYFEEFPDFGDLICDFYLDTIMHWDAGFLSGANTPYMPNGAFLHSNTPITSYRLYYLKDDPNAYYCGYLGYPVGTMFSHGQYYYYLGTLSDLFVHWYPAEGGGHRFCCYYDGSVKISLAWSWPSDHVFDYAKDSCMNYFYRNLINYNEKIDLNSKFSLSPNPATDFVQISSHSSHNFSYEVYNMHGQLIKEDKDFIFNTSIDISTLKKGIYFIHLITKNDRKVKRIIKI